MKVGDWLALAREIARSGKQVVISTLALLQAPSELNELKRYVENGEFLFEANDLGAVNMAAERGLPFVAGHALNCYNAYTLRLLRRQGMMRWCMPVELSRDWLANLLAQCDELGFRHDFEVEVLSYGHLPLAYSARCFTARSENRGKDECETCCIKYPQGRMMRSQEQQQVFVLNGIQTMSGYCYNLGNELPSMQGTGGHRAAVAAGCRDTGANRCLPRQRTRRAAAGLDRPRRLQRLLAPRGGAGVGVLAR